MLNVKPNKIHQTAIIEGNVVIGSGNVIGPHVVLYGPLTIGNNNILEVGVVIGTPGENTRDPRRDVSGGCIVIGNDCILKEYAVVQKPCFGALTSVGNRVFLMHGAHVAHDCVVEDDVVITPMVNLAGIVTICRGANLALSSQIHQRSIVGDYSIVGMGASLVKNLRPFSRFIPGKPLTVNEYAIEKFGLVQWREEIIEYVCERKQPRSQDIRLITERFEHLHTSSGRAEYV